MRLMSIMTIAIFNDPNASECKFHSLQLHDVSPRVSNVNVSSCFGTSELDD